MIATTTAARIAHDEATAAAFAELSKWTGYRNGLVKGLHRDLGHQPTVRYGSTYRQSVEDTLAEAEAFVARDEATLDRAKGEAMTYHRLNDTLALWAKYGAKVEELTLALAALDAEYTGWTRAFLVTNSNGHVHSSMNCSTCNRNGKATTFAWVTDFSDHDEAQIVAAAGWRACTVCYPTAPVVGMTAKAAKAALPSTIKNDGSIKA